jgi:hypothetical protein
VVALSSTLTHEPKHTSAAPVKSKSGPFKRAVRNVLGVRDAAQPAPGMAEYDTFPRHDAHTQILPPVRPPFTPSEDARWILSQVRRLVEADREHAALAKQKAAAIPAAPANSHPGYLLHYLAILALDLEVIPDLDFRQAVDRLRVTMEEFSARALAEQAFERRDPRHAGQAEQDAAELAVAARSRDAQLVTETVIGEDGEAREFLPGTKNEMLERALWASDPTQTMHNMPPVPQTDPRLPAPPVEVTQVLPLAAQFPPFGQDNGRAHPEVVEPESPVHPAEEPAPVPPAEPVGPEALPVRKPPPVSFPAVMVGEPGDAALRDGTPMVAKRLVEGCEGMWILHEDGACWALIADVSASNSGRTVYVMLADGRKLEVHADREVPVLSPAEAKALLTEARSGGAA